MRERNEQLLDDAEIAKCLRQATPSTYAEAGVRCTSLVLG